MPSHHRRGRPHLLQTIEGTRRVFTGEYRHTVDDKGRIAVPAKFRAQLGSGAVVSRWLDACLAIHTTEGFADLAAKVAALPMTDQTSRRFQRRIFAGTAELELDGQGRILLPPFLRAEIGLGSEAVIVGSRDHAEIWVPATWETYDQELDDPQELAQAFQGLGI